MRPARRLVVHTVVLLCPLFATIAGYVWLDPFKVVRAHENYYSDWKVPPNRDHVSTELLLAHPPGSYDSLILGNSRSLAFLCGDWARHLDPAAKPFHFDASGETLFGLWTKLKFLYARGDRIRHALVLIDGDLLRGISDHQAVPFIKDYRVSGEQYWKFQWVFFREIFANGFSWKYARYRLTGHPAGAVEGIFDDRVFSHDPSTNDLRFLSEDADTERLGAAYFEDPKRFPRRPAPLVAAPVIEQRQLEMLTDAARALESQGTEFFVIIPPLFDRKAIAPQDLTILKRLFGRNRVLNYSGSNAFTDDIHNYYETSHFRPPVARAIMAEAYGQNHVM